MAVRASVVARRPGETSLAPHRTLDALPHIAEAVVAVPGQVLIEADRDKEGGLAFIRGHGTYQEEDDAAAAMEEEGRREGGRVRLCACNAGVIERVNKLVTVLPPKTRYQGAIGDLVVGRITEVGAKRWKVDLRGHKDAILQLSAVILPDGLQRIRGHEDVLQMRRFYLEKDLISAEVQNVMSDGTVHLHTRTVRYGKLENGLLVYVRPSLVRRSKHHFITLPRQGVDIILGVNGYVWVSRSLSLSREGGVEGGREGREEELQTGKAEVLLALQVAHAARPTTSQERLQIARVRNALLLLDQAFLSISLETIERVCAVSEALDLPPALLLSPTGAQAILAALLDEDEDGGREKDGEKDRRMKS